MSPQSRRRQDPRGGSGGPRHATATAPPPNALFEELLPAARELLAVRSPLDAELMVSELLGTWWGERGDSAHGGPRGGSDVERLVGEGLVDFAARCVRPRHVAFAGTRYRQLATTVPGMWDACLNNCCEMPPRGRPSGDDRANGRGAGANSRSP